MTSLCFSLSCIGEGNGNPLQCSCLENHRDGGAWRAAISGVARSRTRLKRLSSNSSSRFSFVLQTLYQKYFTLIAPYICICMYICCLVAQSCPTLCDPMDCSPPGFSVHGISQARILEWVAISFSRGSS